MVLFKNQLFALGFRRFSRKKDPWKEWKWKVPMEKSSVGHLPFPNSHGIPQVDAFCMGQRLIFKANARSVGQRKAKSVKASRFPVQGVN